MLMSPEDYRCWEHRAVTLLGMSGVGKTTVANALPKNNWFHFSGDYRIGTKYLEEPILDNVKRKAMEVEFLRDLLRSDSIYIASNITVHNLEPISTFLGKPGRADLGGLSLAEFQRRQRLHRQAEIAAMNDVAEFLHKARDIYGYEHFVNDAGGSICDLGDPQPIQTLIENTLILYIRAGDDMEAEITRRSLAHPKPMYYSDSFLEQAVPAFLAEEGLESIDNADPDLFARWAFPRLLRHRRPLYEALGYGHGYVVDAADASQIRDEQDFDALVESALANPPERNFDTEKSVA